MATRFYLRSVLDAPVSPPFDGDWDDDSAMVRASMHPAKTASAMVTRDSPATLITGADQALGVVQYISRPLAAQTVSGSGLARGQVRCKEAGILDNFNRVLLSVRLFDITGTIERSVWFTVAQATTNPEFNTVLENRRIYPSGGGVQLILDSLDREVLEGDRLVIDLGVRNTTITILGARGSLSLGDDAGTDLTDNVTTQSALNPWIETDHTFVFMPQVLAMSATATATPSLQAVKTTRTLAAEPSFTPVLQAVQSLPRSLSLSMQALPLLVGVASPNFRAIAASTTFSATLAAQSVGVAIARALIVVTVMLPSLAAQKIAAVVARALAVTSNTVAAVGVQTLSLYSRTLAATSTLVATLVELFSHVPPPIFASIGRALLRLIGRDVQAGTVRSGAGASKFPAGDAISSGSSTPATPVPHALPTNDTLGVRRCPSAYMAAISPVMEVDPSSGGGQIGPVFASQLLFTLHALPAMLASSDEVHWIASCHEVPSTGTFGPELFSIGLTPSGRIVGRVAYSVDGVTPGGGEVLTPAGTVAADGQLHTVALDINSAGDTRVVYDGLVLRSEPRFFGATGMSSPGSLPIRLMLFNGRDGRTRVDMTAYHWAVRAFGADLAWFMNENSGPALYDYERASEPPEYVKDWTRRDAVAPGTGFWTEQNGVALLPLTLQWYNPASNGLPLLWGNIPTSDPADCYSWGAAGGFRRKATPLSGYRRVPPPETGFRR